MHLEWWHWVVGGIVLILAELAIPSFFIVWFGLGALLVGLLALAFDLSLTAQLATWTLASWARRNGLASPTRPWRPANGSGSFQWKAVFSR